MNSWKAMRCAVLVAVFALALAPMSAEACVNAWNMTATRGDGQVTLAWGELPEGHSAKIVRSIYGWPSDPTFGDAEQMGCWVNEPDAVVYRGAERSFVDTGVVNGRTYWYTLFVRNDANGEYLYDKSEVVITPGPVDTISTPKLGTSYVREDYRFKLVAGISNKHTVNTKMVVVMSRKVGTKWVWAKTVTRTLPEGVTYFSTVTSAPTTGSYRVVVKHVGLGERVAVSPAKYFTSHR
jgi:hypothetical protein